MPAQTGVDYHPVESWRHESSLAEQRILVNTGALVDPRYLAGGRGPLRKILAIGHASTGMVQALECGHRIWRVKSLAFHLQKQAHCPLCRHEEIIPKGGRTR